jgi:hypothetical protein
VSLAAVRSLVTRRIVSAALSSVRAQSAKLHTAEEVAARGIEAATKVDEEIDRSGSVFDRALEQSIAEAASLKTERARHAAADRIQRRIALRAMVEEAAMEGVRKARYAPRRVIPKTRHLHPQRGEENQKWRWPIARSPPGCL